MSQATQALSVAIPPSVSSFAAEQGVASILPRVVAMTRQVFPHGNLDVLLDEDPEIPDDRHIVIAVTDPQVPVAQALESRSRWHRDLFACCPAPLVSVFRLGLELGR